MKKKNCAVSILLAFLMIASCAACAKTASPEQSGAMEPQEIENAPVTMSEEMTFREMVEAYGESAGIAYTDAQGNFADKPENLSDEDACYRILSVKLEVDDDYSPRLELYCEMAGDETAQSAGSICAVLVAGTSGEVSKQFGGEAQAWLREGNSIEYVVNGDFFNKGATTHESEAIAEAGAADSALYTSQVSEASNHYKYFYEHRTVEYGEAEV